MGDAWVSIITGIFTLSGVVGGGWITTSGNSKIQKEKLSIEIDRDLEKEKREREIQKMKVYNNVLKVNGENSIVTRIGGPYRSIDIDEYMEEIRPFLYQYLHLLDEDVALILNEIDNKIAEANFNEEITHKEETYLSEKYLDLISFIRDHLDEFRQSTLAIHKTHNNSTNE